MSYVDDSYFHKPPRIDEQFGVGQQFSTKSKLKLKIVDFHVQRNIELEVTNSSKSKLVIKCKDSICPWRRNNSPIIILDPVKINKGRRKKIRIPMVIDEMEGCINRLPTRGRARSSRT
jgi:hypothetical protein